MRSGFFKIGPAFGIDIRVHWTFFLLLFYFAFVGYQGADNLVGALATVAVIVALFVCVLLHEFGHSLVAQRLSIEIPDITLPPIGGAARFKTLPEKPMDEVKIVVAGPLVNVVLTPIFFGIGITLGADPLTIGSPVGGFGSVGRFFIYLGYVNGALVLFNMLPASAPGRRCRLDSLQRCHPEGRKHPSGISRKETRI